MGTIICICCTTFDGIGSISKGLFETYVNILYSIIGLIEILRHTIEHNCIEIILYFSCCPNWSTSSLVGASYNWILILLGFIFPTCIIIFSNIFIMKKLQKVVSKWVDSILFSIKRIKINKVITVNLRIKFYSKPKMYPWEKTQFLSFHLIIMILKGEDPTKEAVEEDKDQILRLQKPWQ